MLTDFFSLIVFFWSFLNKDISCLNEGVKKRLFVFEIGCLEIRTKRIEIHKFGGYYIKRKPQEEDHCNIHLLDFVINSNSHSTSFPRL